MASERARRFGGERADATLADLGEFGLIARLSERLPGGAGLLLGIGDDAAELAVDGGRLLTTVDLLVEGRHFTSRHDPLNLGYKTLAVNVSDIAAMGGTPTYALLGLSLPKATPVSWLDRFAEGLSQAALEYGVAIAGGDTTGGSAIVLSLTMLGKPPRAGVVTRGGARAGDLVCLTNSTGDSYAGLQVLGAGEGSPAQLSEAARRYLIDRHERPQARVAAGGLAAELGARAMIDVSDGLLADLGHICSRSGVAAEIDAAAVPLTAELRAAASALGFDPLSAALTGGEDFELLMAVPGERFDDLAAEVEATGGELRAIGRFAPGEGVRLIGAVLPQQTGWDHFSRS